ncbi:uncharacterized protein LOC120167007 [Hibiscus syriacus]|uniref:uncharacterized protein LOC120167007 n=1 Tax=Hibiscus syriacus TaxID=106335 RepID=UPI001924F272|nr:uncharacterized protein LOC120167007 [Hibiscus syriacus]
MRGPKILLLLYADDSIMFLKNSLQEAQKINKLLKIYETSGQNINYDKSSIYFSKNIHPLHRQDIKHVFGEEEKQEPGSYLGLPLVVRKGKIQNFNFIIDKRSERIQGWTKNLISFGGGETFLKLVAQALPTYVMSCYLLLEGIIDNITRQIRSFWWSGKQEKRGWAMVSWDKVFKSKYFSKSDFINAKIGDTASYAWASIFKAKKTLKDGFFWRISADGKTRMFIDKVEGLIAH